MKENLVIITTLNTIGSDEQTKIINTRLSEGWNIASVTPQHISVTGHYANSKCGNFLIVLEREKIEL